MRSPEQTEQEPQYEALRAELEAFLPSVGEKVMALRREAESDPDFARMKADKTIVTKADELAEDLIRAWITERFPDDTIGGEEREKRQGGARAWIIDPIDGTYNFSNFGNKYGISVGLIENNVPKMGVIYYPAEHVSLSASEGAGAFMDGQPLEVPAGKEDLHEALLLASVHPFHRADPRFEETNKQLDTLLEFAHHRDLGWSFTVDFLSLLQGDADAALHPRATPYDIGAMSAIAKELHFTVSGFDGQPIDFLKEKITIVISKNPKLHAAIIERLNS